MYNKKNRFVATRFLQKIDRWNLVMVFKYFLLSSVRKSTLDNTENVHQNRAVLIRYNSIVMHWKSSFHKVLQKIAWAIVWKKTQVYASQFDRDIRKILRGSFILPHPLYVNDRTNGRIQLFCNGTTSGITIAGRTASGTNFTNPYDIRLDSQLNLYVADVL